MLLKYFFIIYFYFTFFSERGEGREKVRERNISVWEILWSVASHMPSTWDLAHNPGMHPDWELNQQPFGL